MLNYVKKNKKYFFTSLVKINYYLQTNNAFCSITPNLKPHQAIVHKISYHKLLFLPDIFGKMQFEKKNK